MRRIESHDDIREGLAELFRLDPRLTAIHAVTGLPPLRRNAAGFDGLASIIIAQQVSVASARAIEARSRAVFGTLTPDHLAIATDDDFRAAGLSRPKIRTLRAVAVALQSGMLDLDSLAERPAEQAHAALCELPGIGPWTADVYLLFCLGHADAFAPGDLALQEAARQAFDLPARPSAKELAALAIRWSPWRGVAARLLWAYYACLKQGRDGAPLLAETPR